MRYRTSAHSRYSIYYHLVFCPKYRRKVLTGRLETRLKDIVREMAVHHDWIIEESEADRDHIHICLSAPPRYSPSEIVKLIKTWTQKKIFTEFKEIKQYLWGGKMWCEGYFVSTVHDSTTKEEIKQYIRNQKKIISQLPLLEI